MLLSTKGVFRFDPETKEMYLAQIHPRVTVEDVKKDVPWDLKVASDLTETPTLRMRRSILSGDLPRLSLRGGSCPWN
jgi:glutaconate CoA-transferase subunit B